MRLILLIFLLFFWIFPRFSYAESANTIRVYVTVDWEGWSLDEDNLAEMRAFRKQYPHIPMLQLLNPVYFVRPLVNQADTYASISSTFLPIDMHGLHLHGWKSLMQTCQIPYQSAPSYDSLKETCEGGECGYTVSLEYAYSQQDLTQLVACSSDLLVQQGFKRPTSFRAGGWQLGPKLTAALVSNGYAIDTSKTDANLLKTRWAADSGLVTMVSALHPNSTPLDQPYLLAEGLMEYPNNASLADYTSTAQILSLFKQLITHQKTHMVLGFHQETATSFLYELASAIPLMEKMAKEAGITIEWALPSGAP